MRTGLIVLLMPFLLACSSVSTTDRAVHFARSYCSKPDTLKKEEFIVHSYVRVPKGLRVDLVQPYVEKVNAHAESVTSYLIQILASRHYRELTDGDVIPTDTSLLRSFRSDSISDMTDRGGLRLAWIGKREFVTWDDSHFPDDERGLPLPANRFIQVEGSRCSAFFKTFGYSDGWGCNGPYVPKQGLFAFIATTGFDLGAFIENHYFVAPERSQASLCQKAHLAQDCFRFTEASYMKLKDQWQSDNLTCMGKAACWVPGGPLSPHPIQRLRWLSSYTLDLILTASIRISKQTQGDWITSRIEFDPGLMCQNAKPLSDLYTH